LILEDGEIQEVVEMRERETPRSSPFFFFQEEATSHGHDSPGK
jgi:hypothetical protein